MDIIKRLGGIVNVYEEFRGAEAYESFFAICDEGDFIYFYHKYGFEQVKEYLGKCTYFFIDGENYETPILVNNIDQLWDIINSLYTIDFFYEIFDGGFDHLVERWFDVEKLKKALYEEEEEEMLEEAPADPDKDEGKTQEYCPHCDTIVELDAELKVQTCPNCGKRIVTCSVCRAVDCENIAPCKFCPLCYQAAKENEELENGK